MIPIPQLPDIWLFLAIVALASWFQAVTGFGLGMIVIALGAVLAVSGVPELAATISLLAMVNVVTSLAGHWRSVDLPMWGAITLGQVIGIPAGVWLLLTLSIEFAVVVEILLGLFVLAGSVSMVISPHAGTARMTRAQFVMSGLAGGVVGGMFAASAPVLGYVGYRQPLSVDVVRATLLACFGITTLVRTSVVAWTGGLTAGVLTAAAIALPVVVFCSWFGTRYRLPVSDASLRRVAFLALALSGVWLVAGGVLDLATGEALRPG